jgi:hypothetical protein
MRRTGLTGYACPEPVEGVCADEGAAATTQIQIAAADLILMLLLRMLRFVQLVRRF